MQMAEPQKATSSAVDSKAKEKISVLDEEIGKDFLNSWKSMSVTEEDAMDFSFGTISKGKEKAFNFEKLDMEFNLDGDFDKLSSFKMDMPDLDFSSPSKKNAKAKEKSKDRGKQQEKNDRFTFSFDFNELDGFDFDSSLSEGDKTCKKIQERKSVASEISEVSKIDQALEDDCITEKLPASKDATNSKAETSKGKADACNSMDDPSPLKAVSTKGIAPGNLVDAQGSRISPEKSVDTGTKETYTSSPLSDREVSLELYDQRSLQSSPMDSLSRNNSNQETVSDMQAKFCSQGRRINTSLAEEQNINNKMISNEGTNQGNLQWKNSILLSESDRDERKGVGGNIPAEINDSQLVEGDIILKDISTASLSGEILDNSAAKKDIQNPISKLPSFSSDRCSKPTVSELTARKDKEAGAIHSRFFRRSEENKSQLHQPSATGKDVSSFNRKRIGDKHLCRTYEKRDDSDGGEAENRRKPVGYSKVSSQESTKGKPVLLQSENNAESSSDIRDGFTADAAQNGGNKLISKSSLQDKAATKGEPVLLRIEKNVSLQANPPNHAEKTEFGVQTSVNPKLQVQKLESIQNSKFLREAHKILKKAPALSSFKSTRTVGTNKDQLSSQRETNSLRNLEQNKNTPGNTSKIVLPVGNAEKQTPKLPSLKRKTLEESNGDLMLLKPLKRLLPSPSESRNPKESSQRVADKEVQNTNKNHMEESTKNILFDHLTSRSEVPREVKVTELEFPSVMEDDGNMEKAEAYGKELEDICNMLKKKHEEAKEILVRAIVNNNNLLMLNHPIFQEKISFPFCLFAVISFSQLTYIAITEVARSFTIKNIRMVQKFAELLISKEIPT
ncbi:LOW QUALITY PROTEIN: uncharacterized protein At4g18490 [Durio zibethinus]|uniref:LOW QUALITY PROTEIN: uncharacterized protein At4g18490 n=1 Tax=Durio zibethinus TaxID=66656 RepID=A0A6P5WIJ7_DURZI|nr:LOW QUALITY PROTEIN: uncharacterized protein At4g18490 [Durio zibethinus]